MGELISVAENHSTLKRLNLEDAKNKDENRKNHYFKAKPAKRNSILDQSIFFHEIPHKNDNFF